MNELDVAEAIRDGRLPSPQRYANLWLFDIRITGTDVAWRAGLKEYAIRNPRFYLNDRFLERCQGLPVILEHPPEEKLMLDTGEFRRRVVGTCFLPYIKADEVWSVAKIFDARAGQLMADRQLSTSPAVVFRNGTGQHLKTDKGNSVFIEPDAALLDHIAVVPAGVWDKLGPPDGIRVDKGAYVT